MSEALRAVASEWQHFVEIHARDMQLLRQFVFPMTESLPHEDQFLDLIAGEDALDGARGDTKTV